jgi:hypothetical protein
VARYRKVDLRIWNDAKFMSLTERGKLVFLFLITHPNLTMVGALRGTISGLASEYGISSQAFGEAFGEAFRKTMVKVDSKACLIWLPNFLKYNKPESPNVVKSWPDSFDLLPECDLKDEIYEHVKDFVEGLTKAFREAYAEAFGEAFRKAMPNHKHQHKHEHEHERTLLSPQRQVAGDPEVAIAPDLPAPEVSPQDFAEAWNRMRGPLPGIREFTKSRQAKLRVRITQGLTLESFEAVIKQCLETPFLRGENKRGWMVDFDWLIENDTNMAKVMEGSYSSSGAQTDPPVRLSTAASIGTWDQKQTSAQETLDQILGMFMPERISAMRDAYKHDQPMSAIDRETIMEIIKLECQVEAERVA